MLLDTALDWCSQAKCGRQLRVPLMGLHYTVSDQIENAGKAAKILDRLDKRRNEGLTTPKQIRFLEGRGFKHVGTWQFNTAKNLIDRIAGNGWKIPNDIVPQEYKGA